jgi:serine/threonine protein kinase/tetratricopeptide (TPR) repeat protein
MTDARWSERSIFEAAIDKGSPEERAEYLDQVCGSNPGLRQEVEALLAAHERLGNFSVATTVDERTTEGVGTVIGPYKLLEQIGEGGFGVVFMAEQQEPIRRKVALKVIKPGMDTRQVIARFEAERQALAIMDHPNIAKVLDAGQTATGRPFFLMDLVKGQPITDYCDQCQLAPHDRLELFNHVCQAVQHAHQKGIIHRDLKPSNVLVTLHDGTPLVKIIDFGIAKAVGRPLTDKTLFTGFAQMIGTPLYMSPEQAALSNVDVDTRSDIYSLGVLLYELLTGTTPFDKERLKTVGFDELRRIIREEEPPKSSTRISTLGQAATTASEKRHSDPRKLSRLFRGDLDWIVMKALEKDRNRRYETASALAADVKRYLADEPVLACPPSAWYRFRKLARRHRAALAAAIMIFIAVLVAVGGLAGGIGWAVRDQDVRRTAAEEKARAALDEAVRLEQEEKWPEALSAARRSQEILAGVGADPDLSQRVDELAKDLEMVRRLEEARLQLSAAAQAGEFDYQGSHEAYAAAFAWYDLDVESLDPHEAAERIRSRSIALQLAMCIDYWVHDQRHLGLQGWRRLLGVSRAADPDPWRNRVRDALERSDPMALQEAAASVPDDVPPATAMMLASVSVGTDAAKVALATLEQVQQRHPDDFGVNLELGEYLLVVCRPRRAEEAIRYLTAAVALRPQNLAAHRDLGCAFIYTGQSDKAITELNEAIRINKENALAHYNLGVALENRGQPDKVIAEYREAIRLKRDFVEPHNNLGEALRRTGQLDEAIAEFREAIRLKNDLAVAHSNLGLGLAQLGQQEAAVAEFRQAIALDPSDAKAHNNLGATLRVQGQLEAAEAEFRKAIVLDSKYALAHTNLANHLREKGQLDEAIAEYREAIRLERTACERSPESLKGSQDLRTNYLGLAVVLIRLSDHQAAAKAAGGDCFDWFHLAMAHWDLGEKKKARQLYDKAALWMEEHRDHSWDQLREEAAALLELPHLVRFRAIPYMVNAPPWSINVLGLAFTPDSRRILATGDGNDLRLYEVETGKEIRRFTGHTHWVHALAISGDGKLALSGGQDMRLRFWNVDTSEEVRQFTGHTTPVRFVAFSPDRKQAISGGADEADIRLWNVDKGTLTRRFTGHKGEIYYAAFSPDGRELVSVSADKTIRVWNVESGEEVRQFEDAGAATYVCLSQDGKKALSVGPDDAAPLLWDFATGKRLNRLKGAGDKKDPPHEAAFTADGQFAVTAHDRKVRLWDVAKGQELYWVELKDLHPNRVAISRDGRCIASANWRGWVLIWNLIDPRPRRQQDEETRGQSPR